MKNFAIIIALLMAAPCAFSAENAVEAVEKVNYYTRQASSARTKKFKSI